MLDAADFAVGKGRITGVVGEDYGQVYCLFAILSGTYIPDTGTVRRNEELASDPPFYIRGNLTRDPAMTCIGYYRTASAGYPHRDEVQFRRLCERYGIQPSARIYSLSKGTMDLLDLMVGISCRPSLIIAQDLLAGLDDDAYDMMVDDLQEANRRGTAVLISSPSEDELREYCHEVIDLRDRDFHIRSSIGFGNNGAVVLDRIAPPRSLWMYALSILPFIISCGFIDTGSNLLSVALGCAALMTTYFLSDVRISFGQDIRKVSMGVDRIVLESRRCTAFVLCALAAALCTAAFCHISGMGGDAVLSGAAICIIFLPLTLLRHRTMLSYRGDVFAVNMMAHLVLGIVLFFFMTAEPGSLLLDGTASAAIISASVIISAFLMRDCIRYFRWKDLETVSNLRRE